MFEAPPRRQGLTLQRQRTWKLNYSKTPNVAFPVEEREKVHICSYFACSHSWIHEARTRLICTSNMSNLAQNHFLVYGCYTLFILFYSKQYKAGVANDHFAWRIWRLKGFIANHGFAIACDTVHACRISVESATAPLAPQLLPAVSWPANETMLGYSVGHYREIRPSLPCY